jgi:hypothetical protein
MTRPWIGSWVLVGAQEEPERVQGTMHCEVRQGDWAVHVYR